jgi:hypothetical protein
VFHLELAAIHLEDILLAAVQDLGQSFDCFGFAGAGRSQEEEHPDGASFGSQPGQEHLDIRHDNACRLGLSHYFLGKNRGEVFNRICPLFPRSGL